MPATAHVFSLATWLAGYMYREAQTPPPIQTHTHLETVELQAEERRPGGRRRAPVLLPLLVVVLPRFCYVREQAFAYFLFSLRVDPTELCGGRLPSQPFGGDMNRTIITRAFQGEKPNVMRQAARN